MSGGAPGEIVRRSVTVSRHRTSISLERAFWSALEEVARTEGTSIDALVSRIDRRRTGNLSGAVRLYVLDWFRVRAG
jgi:predicted DNA-binding ribbon-helix-helix protein